MSSGSSPRAECVVDLDAIAANLHLVRDLASPADLMVVVKANGYGHGASPVAELARALGVAWLGAALPEEAMRLRRAGDRGRILTWLWTPSDPGVAECVASGVDIAVSSQRTLADVVKASQSSGVTARVHLKVDTGLTRNGETESQWSNLLSRVSREVKAGTISVQGTWSHLASADARGAAVAGAQRRRFETALIEVERHGLRPGMRHLASSGALWTDPASRFDLVRVGIAAYGLTPGHQLGSSASLGLRPALTLRTSLAHVKRIPKGVGVSYGPQWVADRPTTIGLVPLGYADGIPRAASGKARVLVGTRLVPVVGRIAMDQLMVDLGPEASDVDGDPVVLFSDGRDGAWTADDWASVTDSIGYEVVARIGERVPRRYEGGKR